MWNSEQKLEFLNTITNDNSYRSFQRVFKTIEDMEERFGKDISEMSVDEALTVMDFKTGTRQTNAEHTMSLIRSYIDWCIQNGKTNSENNFDKIDSSDVDQGRVYRTKYIGSPEEFEKMIASVFSEHYEYNADIERPKELSVRLCYEGFEDEEIVLLKKTDIDYENSIIKSPIYDGIVYKVSNRVLELCKFCSEQEEIEYPARRGSRKERLCNNDYVLRQRIGTLRGNPEDRPISKTNVMRRVKEFNDAYVENTGNYKNITASKLRESKLFYDIHVCKDKTLYLDKVIRPDLEKRGIESGRKIYERLRQIKFSFKLWENTFY